MHPTIHESDSDPTVLHPADWWRRTCWVTPQLALSGDLPSRHDDALAHLHGWQADGITHVVDVRLERNDESFVAANAPDLGYSWIGADDHGGRQSDLWFAEGVGASLAAIGEPGGRVLVHCHMGVNRGPSMGLAILVAMGWDSLDALHAIRRARPISGLIYATDAVDWWHRVVGSSDTVRRTEITRVRAWLAEHHVDTDWVISRIWRAGG
jgi:dual specificity phosphatase 3